MTTAPFADRVRHINACFHTYAQMAGMTGRSAAWWNNLALGKSVNPPPPDLIPDMASMLGVPERRIREMIAEEWYGVRPDDSASRRAMALSSDLVMLDDADYEVVEKLTRHLSSLARDRFHRELDEQEQSEAPDSCPASSPTTSDETADGSCP
ncbi:helix-turn-helix transcriptional regulator [Streptomyces sp. ME08-AFT2]|uniref:helix-turn-helix domain-containing protein n=1 Tax=Streptomyces sp. ME08-AFT2 TaxID=3028683 RepID=UPI0029B0F75E|nr:helix-turn-helix transcriptional regulator [Streptomyces sp. ME08-AFT2]MDX3313048.1 helix-turn-helix transcriptional regulator [Streptomyces sp. ME08-AFT2]